MSFANLDLASIGMVDGISIIKPNRKLKPVAIGNSEDHLSITSHGINLAFVNLFIEGCGGRVALESFTTAQMAETIIKPLTSTKKDSLCDRLIELGRKDAVQDADVFISHAWSYSFLDMIDAVNEFALETGKKPDDLYIWLDLVTNSQHGVEEKPFVWWKTTFINAVKNIKNVVLVLQPWDDPIPLTRA
ncbi:Kinesin light chain 3, partial [Blyttiomyces sp. JEL0837]